MMNYIVLMSLLSAGHVWTYDTTLKVGDLVVSGFNFEEEIYQILAIEPTHKHNKDCSFRDVIEANPIFRLKLIFDDKHRFVLNRSILKEMDPTWLRKLDHEYIKARISRLLFIEEFLEE